MHKIKPFLKKNTELFGHKLSLHEIFHSHRVMHYALEIGKGLNFSDIELSKLLYSSLNHDIGKMFLPEEILMAPRKLTKEEFAIIQLHPIYGYELAQQYNALTGHELDILSHHESFDGSGYPYGLKGDEIPLNARIIKIADVFDALVSPRPYKQMMHFDKALSIIESNSNEFDPYCLETFYTLSPLFQSHTEHVTYSLNSLLSING